MQFPLHAYPASPCGVVTEVASVERAFNPRTSNTPPGVSTGMRYCIGVVTKHRSFPRKIPVWYCEPPVAMSLRSLMSNPLATPDPRSSRPDAAQAGGPTVPEVEGQLHIRASVLAS